MGCGASSSKPSGRGEARYNKLEDGKEPERKRRVSTKHYHFTERHGPQHFFTARKILEAYPETLHQQRTRHHTETEISDAQIHKMKWKHTYCKAPLKLLCCDCGGVILRLQDELEFHFCKRCWETSNHTIRYELCTKCFRKLERKGSEAEKENVAGATNFERKSSKKRVSFEEDEDQEPRVLKLGDEAWEAGEAPRGRAQPGPAFVQQVAAQYGIDESAPDFGYQADAYGWGYDQHYHAQVIRAQQHGSQYRRASAPRGVFVEPPQPSAQHAGVHPAAEARRPFVPPPEPTAMHNGIHPAAAEPTKRGSRNFVPPPEPTAMHSGVHPAAMGYQPAPQSGGAGAAGQLRRSRSDRGESREERRERRHSTGGPPVRARSNRV